MEYLNRIDRKIAEKFRGHTEDPPAEIWENIRSELGNTPKGRGLSSGRAVWKIGAAAAIIALLAGYFLFLPHQKVNYQPREELSSLMVEEENEYAGLNDKPDTRKTKRYRQIAEKDPERMQGEEIPGEMERDRPDKPAGRGAERIVKKDEGKQQKAETVRQQKEPVNTVNENSERFVFAERSLSDDQAASGEMQAQVEQSQTHSRIVSIDALAHKNIDDMQQAGGIKVLPTDSSVPYALHPQMEAQKLPWSDDTLADLKHPLPYSLGVHINGDIVYNTADALDQPGEELGIAFSGRYHLNNNYFLETGLGMYQTKDAWDYIVEYRSEEISGYYQAVDSVSYTIVQGSAGQDSVVVNYHTRQQAVCDSVDNIDKDISTKTYTFLSIPMLIGYNNNYKRFTYSLSTGMIMAVLVDEKIEHASFDQQNASIIDIEEQLYHRLSTNWYYTLNLGAGYQVSHRWQVMLEPSVKVYIRDLYKEVPADGNQKIPFSIGLRTGIRYRF
ncbi:MAG: hypothetical protein R6U19_03340 [Bacteroidales bacterium]